MTDEHAPPEKAHGDPAYRQSSSTADFPSDRDLLVTFVRKLPAAVAMLDRNLRYLAASDRWWSDFGLNPRDTLGRSHYEIFPEIPETWIDFHRRCLAGETLRADEDKFERADGHTTWLRWEIQPWGMEDGLPQGILIFSEDITQRKQAEILALANASRYSDLFRHSVDGIAHCRMVFDGGVPCDFIYLEVNERFTELTGLKDVVGKAVSEVIPGILESDPEMIEIYGRVAKTGAPEKFELFVKALGQWYAVSAFSPREGYFTAAFEVITERKEMEEALRAERDLLSKIIATAPGAICAFRLGPDGSVSLPYASAGFRRMLPELPDLRDDAQPLFAAMHPEDLQRIQASISESARTMTPWRDAYRIITPGRGAIWLEGHSIPDRDPDGGTTWYGFLSDLTERRRAEISASESARVAGERASIISTLFDTTDQAILAIDERGTIRLANHMAEAMFGYGEGELIGQAHDVLVPEGVREKHAADYQSFFAAPTSRPMGSGLDLSARRKDGSLFPAEIGIGVVNTVQGRLAVGVVADITVRKRQEEALRESERERTRLSIALLTAQEEAARQVARDLHDDITQRLAVLSMQVGKAVVKRHGDEDLSSELRSWQSNVFEIAEGIRKISHRIHPTILDQIGLPASLAAVCRDFDELGGLRVRFEASELPATIDSPVALSIYRVAQTCLSNVAKHARAREAAVALAYDGESLSLTITDNGQGFDPSAQKIGLGMHSMKERIHLMNGSFACISAPGRGTQVIARVPVLPKAATG